MIVETAWKKYKESKERYDTAVENESFGNWVGIAKRSMNTSLYILIISITLSLVFIPFAVFFTIYCGNKKGWPIALMVVLIISFFTPYLGFFTTMFMLIYGIICYTSD
jgi:RsiW-degrading membrane proteinase PrsW (M82 family)